MRPRPRARVSTPLPWNELREDLDPRDLGMEEALARVKRDGDLFAPVLNVPRPLAPAERALGELLGE